MTITPLESRGLHPRPRLTRRPRPVRRRHLAIEDITLTFEIALTGEHRYRDAVDLIESVQQAADEIGAAAVTVTSGPAPLASVAYSAAAADAVDINTDARSVQLGGETVVLTKVEYDLLLFLAEHPHQVFTRRQLLLGAWGHEHAGVRTVDVHVRRLRAKLGDAFITTVRGVGYRLADSATVALSGMAAGVAG
jgi:two-component system, OmpR family, response regulator